MANKSLYYCSWIFVIAVNLYFIYNFPLKHFNIVSWNKPFGPFLTIHIVFGMIAILLGPFQFFPSIRNNYTYIHRFTGRTYLLAVLIAACTSIFLAINHNILIQHRYIFGTGLLGLAAAWLLTSGMALWAIKKRNFDQHREWMIKSYVVTCGFTFFRIFGVSLTRFLELDYQKDMSGISAWACWSVPLLITEAILQGKKMRPQIQVQT